jgi:hypothetical protein
MRFLNWIKSFFKKNTYPQSPQVYPQTFTDLPKGTDNESIDITLFIRNLETYFAKHYKDHQFEGYSIIINKWFEIGLGDLRFLAYALATAYHETAHTMKPVVEYGSKKYLMGKKYWPFIGRGYVQLTWDYNYKKYGIEKTPWKALEPDFSAFILIDGMIRGVFTGKKLSDYFNSKGSDPVQARRIINGMDRAELIAEYYHVILTCLIKSQKSRSNLS